MTPRNREPEARDQPSARDGEAAWHEHRRHVLAVAFRMLGNVTEAEDVVQETFARFVRHDTATIEDPAGWLVVVASRICLDRLRADRRHPVDAGVDFGERPSERAVDPADRVTLDDSVQHALRQVLERLSPAERTAFVLHDVFQYPFDAIAEIVGRSPAACRQLASRARRSVRAETSPGRFVVEPAAQREVIDRFMAACSEGDVAGLLAVLDPEVHGDGDAGGAGAHGPHEVAERLMFFLGPDSGTTMLPVPTDTGPVVVVLRDHRVVTIADVDLRDGRIARLHATVRPAAIASRLAALGI